MINFRYHLISITAIFLALAVGVVLGAGVFSDSLSDGLGGSDQEHAAAELRQQLESNASVNSFQTGYAKAVAPTLLGARLKGRSVVIFSLPGANSDDVKGVVTDVQQAGGSVTAQARLTGKLVDPADRKFVQGVAGQTLDGVKGVPSTANQSSYELVGTALARAFTSTGDAAVKVDESAETIMSAYTESGLLSLGDKPTSRAKLAIFVAGKTDQDTKEGQGELVSMLASAVDANSNGVLVAGPPDAATDQGAVKAVREGDASDQVSTVDVVNVAAGRIVAVLALQREAAGKAGHYGAVDAQDGAMPPLSN